MFLGRFTSHPQLTPSVGVYCTWRGPWGVFIMFRSQSLGMLVAILRNHYNIFW